MRRLIALVVIVDVIGGAALAFALTRPGSHHPPTQTQTAALVSHPINPFTETVSSPTTSSVAKTAPKAHRRHHHAQRVPVTRPVGGCPFALKAAQAATASETGAGYRVGFALVSSTGRTVAAVDGNEQNYGASITKAMLLVAYLRDHTRSGLDSASVGELTPMIEVSDNTAADWVYAHLSSPAQDVENVAAAAGMTGFRLDLSDPVYTLGQSLITAHDFALFFARIQTLIPGRYRTFGMNLLAHVEQRVGLLAAGLPGTVYSKEGWKPENAGLLGAPYVVNQAAQFSCNGMRYGLAVTVGKAADQAAAESVVQRIASSLIN